MKRYLLHEPSETKILAERLSRLENISKFNNENYNEGWVLVHSFSDLEHSFNKFTDEYLPKLVKENLTDQEINELLIEIGEEFRHMIYHIRDPKSLRIYTEEIKE